MSQFYNESLRTSLYAEIEHLEVEERDLEDYIDRLHECFEFAKSRGWNIDKYLALITEAEEQQTAVEESISAKRSEIEHSGTNRERA